MSMAPSRTLVLEKAEELKNRILSKFPSVDVEFADWVKLSGPEWRLLETRGFPFPHGGVHACMLIRGDLETAEKAATLADNEVARISEELGVEIQVQKTNHVWCKKSGMLVAQHFEPGQSIQKGPALDYREDKRGITFWCWMTEPHEHDWGRLQPQK